MRCGPKILGLTANTDNDIFDVLQPILSKWKYQFVSSPQFSTNLICWLLIISLYHPGGKRDPANHKPTSKATTAHYLQQKRCNLSTTRLTCVCCSTITIKLATFILHTAKHNTCSWIYSVGKWTRYEKQLLKWISAAPYGPTKWPKKPIYYHQVVECQIDCNNFITL